jgi:modulator of FtsH protease HflC
MNKNALLVAGVVATAALLASTITVVDAREVAVVTAFGKPVRSLTDPGLSFRAPWPVHEVVRFDSRIRLLQVEPAELLTRDKKNLVVEAFVAWRVQDPEQFLEAVGNDAGAELQLSDLAMSRIAAGLGQQDFAALIGEEGDSTPALPDAVVQGIAAEALQLGVEVVDVRLEHLGFPVQNEQSIYERMRAERERIANAYRSEGDEKADGIRAEADRQAAEVLALAELEATSIEAKAEGQAEKIYATAYVADPELYKTLRSLEAAEAILGPDDLIIVHSDSALASPLVDGP